MGPVFAWLALAYRLASEHTDRLAGSARLKLLLRAEKSARDARRAAAKTTVVQAHAFRESAEVAALLGDTEAAMGYLVESKRVAEQHGMLLELAWTNWSLARIGRAVGWEVSPGLSEAELTLRQFGALIPDLPPVSRGPTPSLENRFASLVEWGPKIVRQLERNEVLDALLESLRASLQAESVFLVDGKFRVCRGEPAGGWSQSLVERAKQSDQVVRNTPTLSESQASIRSIACCRIPTESECLVVVATHRFLGGLFDEQGERALHHLTGLAGTALDNAVRYSEHVALEQEAVTTARRFRDLFEHSGIGTVVCTTKGRILLRNYFFEELLQGRPKRTQSVIYHEDRLQFLELLKRGGVGETRCQRPGGELLWVRLECIVLSGGERLLTFTDISEQRRSALADFERSEGRVLSSEIHDVIAGRLAGVSMHLQSAEVTAASDPGLATAKVRELSSPVSELVEEVDDIILDLRSEVPANFDSLPKIERELGRLGSRLTDVQLPSTPVGGMCGLCLHRTVRECVTNILRHSQCTNVTVNIDASESDIVYEISDDGVGFEPLANPQGRGLVSMTHRCEMLGGSFEVRSVPGQGTTVRATLPLPHGS